MFRLLLPHCCLVFLMIVFAPVAQAQSLSINGVRIWHAPDHTRVVFDISEKANYSISLLENPRRYAIDFQNARNQVVPPTYINNQRIKQIGMTLLSNNRFRYEIPLQKTLRLKSFQLSPNKLYGHRLVVDLFDINEKVEPPRKSTNIVSINKASESKVNPPANPIVNAAPPNSVQNDVPINYAPSVQQKKQIIVAIDAGHGGEDPGALGSRSREKNVTLAIAKRLKKIVDQNPKMKAVLIRTNDYFIRLRTRTNIARKAKADIFISIHADAALNKSARGMSVFALSQRGASSELARSLARKENQADLVGGVSIKDKDDALAEVLLDLSMTNTISESVDLGSSVLSNLSRIGKLHSKRVEQAGFAVLKSPDIPSILVETGFITNRSEEKLLLSRNHQQRVAETIYKGIVQYVRKNPIQSANPNYRLTTTTQRQNNIDSNDSSNIRVQETQYHRVKSGDSLSKIAFRYGISVKQLKTWNKLKSDVAFKGQRLRVSSISSSQNNAERPQGQTDTAKNNSTQVTYKVKRGDTLSGIAQKYGTTMSSIRKNNNLKNNNVYVGQRLSILTKKNLTNNNQTSSIHVVKSGEYLSGISKRYNITINKIKSLNNLRSNNVYIGQRLRLTSDAKISQQNTAQSRSIRVTVRKGQTLSGLALKYKVKQLDIVRWNNLKKRELFIGQRLTIKVKS